MSKKRTEWGIVEQKHKIEMRDFTRKRSYCADKNCKFFGQMAEQGVCYSAPTEPFSKYFEEQMRGAEHLLAFNRKHNYKKLSQRQIMKRLEGEVVCHFMNYCNCLDELVWLRGENAKLRGKLGLFRQDKF